MCAYKNLSLCMCFHHLPWKPLGKILVDACLILSSALVVQSLLACYSHFVDLTQVTVVHEETIQRIYSCVPGKPLGKLPLCTYEPQPCSLYATLDSREASGQGLHCMLLCYLSLD